MLKTSISTVHEKYLIMFTFHFLFGIIKNESPYMDELQTNFSCLLKSIFKNKRQNPTNDVWQFDKWCLTAHM